MHKIIVFSSDSKSLFDFRRHLIKSLKDKGVVVCYCSYDHFFEESKKLFGNMGVEVKPLNFFNTGRNPLKDLRTLKSIYRIFSHEQPTHVLSYHIKPVLYTALCSWFFPKIKIYPTITGLGYLFTSTGISVKVFKAIVYVLYKLAFKRSSKIFFQNKDDLKLFEEKKVVSSHKALLVGGSGVTLDEYAFTPLPEAISFIFVGRINTDKGILEYLEACKHVKKKYPYISFRLAGSFSKNPTFMSVEKIQEYCTNAGVEYLGELADVRPWLRKTTVFVLPSYREGTPRAGLEALSTGRPIITTDVPGCREIIQDGVNGYLILPRNSESLSKAMIRMIEHPEILPKMGQESRKIAEKKFDVTLVNKSMMEAMGLTEETQILSSKK